MTSHKEYDIIRIYYATLQSNQHYNQLHHQPISLTYGGAQAMDVFGGDMTWVPSKGKAPRG